MGKFKHHRAFRLIMLASALPINFVLKLDVAGGIFKIANIVPSLIK